MTIRRCSFALLDPPQRGTLARLRRLWAGLWRRRHLAALPEAPPLVQGNVDFRLRQRAAVLSVRRFVERIDNYQLHSRHIVHVVSHYVVPEVEALAAQVPEWLAHRVRFGVVDPVTRETGYIDIHAVDVVITDEGCELFLHLTRRVEPGTKAFVAAWLGDGDGRTGLPDERGMLIGR